MNGYERGIELYVNEAVDEHNLLVETKHPDEMKIIGDEDTDTLIDSIKAYQFTKYYSKAYGKVCYNLSNYDESAYSMNKKGNRRKRITNPAIDIAVAYGVMLNFGDAVIAVAKQFAVWGEEMRNDGIDHILGSASFQTYVKEQVASRYGTHYTVTDEGGTESSNRRYINDHVFIPLRRIVACDVPDFQEYACISKCASDDLLLDKEPEKFAWLKDRYENSKDEESDAVS